MAGGGLVLLELPKQKSCGLLTEEDLWSINLADVWKVGLTFKKRSIIINREPYVFYYSFLIQSSTPRSFLGPDIFVISIIQKAAVHEGERGKK
jgi:hypothetical protein